MAEFSEEVRHTRRLLGLNQIEFARLLGVSQGSVSKWEAGREAPRSRVFLKIRELAAAAVDGTALSQVKQGQQISTTAVPVTRLLDEAYPDETSDETLATLVLPTVSGLSSGAYEGWLVTSKGMSEDFLAGTIIVTHRHRGFVPVNGDLVVAKLQTKKGIVHSLRYYASSDVSSWLWMKSGRGDASSILTEVLRHDAEYPAIVGLVVASYKLEIPATRAISE